MTEIGFSSPVLLIVIYCIVSGFGRSAIAGAVYLYLCEPASIVSLMKAWNIASQFASCETLFRYAVWRVIARLTKSGMKAS